MDIQTKNMGIVSVDGKPRFEFSSGLFGFESETDFVLLESEFEPFLWLQSMQTQNLAFLVVDPFAFFREYEIDVDDETVRTLNIEKPSDVMVFVIITVPGDGNPITANLQGPLIINKRNNKAKQVILNSPLWKTKHSLMDSLKKRSNKC